MRKIIALCMSMVLTVGLTACGQTAEETTTNVGVVEQDTENTNMEVTQQSGETTQSEEGKQKPQATGSHILVIYFSAADNDGIDGVSSATLTTYDGAEYGATQLAAKYIADYIGADTFSIVTETSYPDDYDSMADMAKKQQDDGEHPALKTHIENLDAYDTVFLVYPIWWYDIPMPLYSLFDEYDFSGKTMIPVALHAGSQFSGTIEKIKELEPNASVEENGYTTSASGIGDKKDEVENWLEELAQLWKEI